MGMHDKRPATEGTPSAVWWDMHALNTEHLAPCMGHGVCDAAGQCPTPALDCLQLASCRGTCLPTPRMCAQPR